MDLWSFRFDIVATQMKIPTVATYLLWLKMVDRYSKSEFEAMAAYNEGIKQEVVIDGQKAM